MSEENPEVESVSPVRLWWRESSKLGFLLAVAALVVGVVGTYYGVRGYRMAEEAAKDRTELQEGRIELEEARKERAAFSTLAQRRVDYLKETTHSHLEEDRVPHVSDTLATIDNSGFTILAREQLWDLRDWEFASDSQRNRGVRVSAATAITKLRIKKNDAAASTFYVPGSTSGTALFVECLSHPELAWLYPEVTIVDGGIEMVQRVLAIDLSELRKEREIVVEVKRTYWNAFQTPSQWFVGSMSVEGADIEGDTELVTLFPEKRHLPATGFRMRQGRRKDEVDVVETDFIARSSPDYYWVLFGKPEPGWTHRFYWVWPPWNPSVR